MPSKTAHNAYLILGGFALALPAAVATAAEKSATGLEEITVTARRREESAQATPVSLTAFSAEELRAAGIKEIRDLTAAVPGVNMTSSGGTNNTVFSIRGRSRAVVGNAQPSVATYVDEVPLSVWGASVPTYDISSVQVLKGPQGTLFGRNTTTGAVLVTSAAPTHDFDGYLQATLGNYQWQQYEGAVNLPLWQDKVALRVSGQTANRDGYTKNMSFPGHDFDNLNRDSYRISLLLEPLDGFRNVTVFERNLNNEVGAGLVFYQYMPGGAIDGVPYYNGTVLTYAPGPIPCNGSPACDIQAAAARQDAAGPRKAWTDLYAFYRGDLKSWSNTTTLDLGPVTLKNIFGYREVYFHNLSDIDATEMSQINADNLVDNQQTTNEFQISGKALNDDFNYIAGYFYSRATPDGPQRLELQQFAVSGTPLDSPAAAPFNGAYGSGAYYRDTSNAYFAQVDYKLGNLSPMLSALSIDLGARHTRDAEQVCNAAFQFIGDPAVTEGQCKALADVSPLDSRASAEFSKTTYTFGLNYQATDDMLIYAVTRTGYRAGGINTPVLGGTLAAFQNYEPETVQDYELGLKSDWNLGGMSERFNVAVYQSKFDKVQAGISVPPTNAGNPAGPDGDSNPLDDPANNTFYANAGKATVKGIETEVAIIPIDELELSASGAYLQRDLDSLTPGLPVSEAAVKSFVFLASPRYSYTLGATYTLPLAELGDIRFNGKFFRISDIQYGTVDAPAYNRTDLRADWLNIAHSNLDIGAFITNLFDKAAIVAPSSSSEGLGANSVIYNEPRMYGVQLRYQFGKK